MPALLEAVELTKRYGEVRALDSLSLSAPQGGVYGVLGRNGAGKSTLFRIWLRLVRPSSGSARVLGSRAGGDPRVSRRIGAMIRRPASIPS